MSLKSASSCQAQDGGLCVSKLIHPEINSPRLKTTAFLSILRKLNITAILSIASLILMFSPTIEAITIEEIKDIFCTDYSSAEIQTEKRSGLIGDTITASVYLTNIQKEENTLDSSLADR